MDIRIEWFEGKYPSFNTSLASASDREPFLIIKGCRIAQGKEGEFIGWPATKNQTSGKYWNHVYASKEFADAVMKKAKEAQPKQATQKQAASDGFDDDLPF